MINQKRLSKAKPEKKMKVLQNWNVLESNLQLHSGKMNTFCNCLILKQTKVVFLTCGDKSDLVRRQIHWQNLLTWFSHEFHIKLTSVKNFTWDSPQTSLYMKLTWIFSCELHVNWDSLEFDMKFFPWISRELYKNNCIFHDFDLIWKYWCCLNNFKREKK